MIRKKLLYSLLAGVALVATMLLTPTPSLAGKPGQTAANGTTLAAVKDLNICKIPDNPGTDVVEPEMWKYYGFISVWQEGAIDTEGLMIKDWIQFKPFGSSGKFKDQYEATVTMGTNVIPAYTPEQEAVVFPYEVIAAPLNGEIRNSATVTIMNHSGHLGTAYGPNPKFTYNGALDAIPVCQRSGGDCAYSWGYWKNHRPDDAANISTDWPGSYNPLALFFSSGQTWAQVLETPPAGGNAYYQLAHQYIAAVLNVAKGAAGVTAITASGGIIEQATTWFGNHAPADCAKLPGQPAQCGEQGAWAGLLDEYNTGGYADEGGPEHCGDDDSTPE